MWESRRRQTTAASFLKEFGYKELAIGSIIKEIALVLHYGPISKEIYEQIAFKLFQKPAPENFFFEIKEIASYLKEINVLRKAELRPALQLLGDAVRKVDEDAFLRVTIQRTQQINGPVVISDGRLNREIEFLNQYGFKAYEIVTSKEIRVQRLKKRDPGFELESLNHSTEQENFSCPKICNNDSLLALRQKMLEIRRRC